MDLKLKNKQFIVIGCTSGLGNSIANELISEGALIIGIGRRESIINELENKYGDRFIGIAGDVGQEEIQKKIISKINKEIFYGALINSGGPPPKSFLETTVEDWDQAFETILRWKVSFTQKLIPLLRHQKFGRLLYIESCSVKQPVANLVLSNSLRLAVVGFVKTLSQEISSTPITLNILAPGFHDTPAIERVFKKHSETHKITYEDSKKALISTIPQQELGNPKNFASMATWLFSPYSQYISGQTISIDGGLIKGTMG